ncbi:hypothetical protein D3C76_624220 [compost metagenome]
MLAGTCGIADGQAQRVAENIVGQGRDDLIVALHRRPGTDAGGVGAVAWADAIESHGIACRHRLGIVRQGEQVVTAGGVVAHDAPHAAPEPFHGRIHGVQVVARGGRRTGHHRHRCHEAQLLGDADHLRGAPPRVGAVAKAGAALQPFDPVHGDVVLLLMAAGMHAQPYVVTRVGPQQRCERVARLTAEAVDVGREQCGATGWPGRRGDGRRCQVQRRDGAVGTALQGVGKVAGHAVGLHAGLAVRCGAVGVEDAQADRFVAVIDHEHARVIHRDGLRARPVGAAQDVPAADLGGRFQQVVGVLAHRWVDGVAEAVGGHREGAAIGLAVRASADIDPGLVGVLEVTVFQEELTVTVVTAIAIVVAGGNHRLP